MRDEEEEDNDPAGTVMEACRSYDLPKLLAPRPEEPITTAVAAG
jgi:hypothetical protein